MLLIALWFAAMAALVLADFVARAQTTPLPPGADKGTLIFLTSYTEIDTFA
jgi:hypothetical protein